MKWGIELESNLPIDDTLCSVVFPTWKLHEEHCGSEIISPILEGLGGFHELKSQLASIWNAYDTVKFLHSGLHIHVDASNFNLGQLKRLLIILVRFEQVIYALLPPQRKGNKWCMPLPMKENQIVRATSFQELEDYQGNERQFGLNLLAFRKHGTLEFRYFPGTLSFKHIRAYVSLVHHIVRHALLHHSIVPSDHNDIEKARLTLFNMIGLWGRNRATLYSMFNTNRNLKPAKQIERELLPSEVENKCAAF